MNNQMALGFLIDALLEQLAIFDEETLDQLSSYRRDKEVALKDFSRILNPDKIGDNRRQKHHWDRVSALLWALFGARFLNLKMYDKESTGEKAGDPLAPTWNDRLKARKRNKKRSPRQTRTKYR